MAYTCTRWIWSGWCDPWPQSPAPELRWFADAERTSASACFFSSSRRLQVETVRAVDQIGDRAGQEHRLPAQDMIREAGHLRHGRAAQVVGERPEVTFPPDPENRRFLGQRDHEGTGPVFRRNKASVAAARRTAGSTVVEASHGELISSLGGRGGHRHGTDVEHDLRRAGTPGLIPVTLDQRHDGAQHHRFRSAQLHDAEQHEQERQGQTSRDAGNADRASPKRRSPWPGSRRTSADRATSQFVSAAARTAKPSIAVPWMYLSAFGGSGGVRRLRLWVDRLGSHDLMSHA